MQKNLILMTNFAIFLATFLMLLAPYSVAAQELPKTVLTLSQPGVYGVNSATPVNTLLVPVNHQNRWNVLYQHTASPYLTAGVQFDPTLHVYVTQPEASLVGSTAVTTAATQASDSAAVSTPSAQVKGVSAVIPETATTSSAITINKFGTEATPKPATATVTPVAPQPVALEPSALDTLFEKYGAEYGLSPTMLKHIAKCESGLRPEALSSNGLYGGLFQFVSPTWSSNRKAMGLDPDPALRFNAEESIKTAAFKMSRDGVGAWPVCGRKATAATVASV